VNEILAVVESYASERDVLEVAAAVAELAGAGVVRADVREMRRGKRPARILTRCAEDDVLAAVLAGDQRDAATCWSVIRETIRPVVLVPPQAHLRRPTITRVLVPLDGTPESAKAAARTFELLHARELDVVVLHVFDETTVPRFWDQPAHSWPAWAAEFIARSGLSPDARLTVRSGQPGARVVEVAEHEHADLIALSWSQQLEPGRARTVRAAVCEATVPLLLLPTY
jgi:nucleotide-binding universal stress UspA family protein